MRSNIFIISVSFALERAVCPNPSPSWQMPNWQAISELVCRQIIMTHNPLSLHFSQVQIFSLILNKKPWFNSISLLCVQRAKWSKLPNGSVANVSASSLWPAFLRRRWALADLYSLYPSLSFSPLFISHSGSLRQTATTGDRLGSSKCQRRRAEKF